MLQSPARQRGDGKFRVSEAVRRTPPTATGQARHPAHSKRLRLAQADIRPFLSLPSASSPFLRQFIVFEAIKDDLTARNF